MSTAFVDFAAEAPTPRQEQRGRERRQVWMSAYAVLEGGQTIDVNLLDLSYEGCAIACQFELRVGERIKLFVLRRGAIDSVVRWVKDGKAGLVFESAMEEPKQQWPRRYQRVVLDAEVKLRRLGKGNFGVRVFDLSPYGCRTELVELPSVDERVLIKFEGLEALEAEICWVEGHVAGLRFVKPMHAAVFELLVERLG